jgi:hypothetical protein
MAAARMKCWAGVSGFVLMVLLLVRVGCGA